MDAVLGFDDAQMTPQGADGGLDAVASAAVAQVKDYGRRIGRPEIQQLKGAAHGAQGLFFSRSGYSPQALAWADDALSWRSTTR